MSRSLNLGILAIGLLCVRSTFAYDAFNNYGPGDTYDTTTGYSVAGTDMDAPLFFLRTSSDRGSPQKLLAYSP